MKNKQEFNRSMDFEIFFDEEGFIEVDITRGDTQDKVNDLMLIQKEYDYLNKCEKRLSKLKKMKKTKDRQNEIDDLYLEIDSQEEYINYYLGGITKH